MEKHSPCRHLKPRLFAFALVGSLASFWNQPLLASEVREPEPKLAQRTVPEVTATVPGEGHSGPTTATPTDPADEWRTDAEPRVVVLHAGTQLTVAPHSQVKRLPMVPGTLGGKHGAKANYSVQVLAGRIDIDIDPKQHPVYGVIVRAPRKVGAIVKSGVASVLARAEDVVIVSRSSKDMLVSLDEHWRPLKTGTLFAVSRQNPTGLSRRLQLPPEVRVETPIALSFGEQVPSTHLEISPVRGSTGYHLAVFRDHAPRPVLTRELGPTDTQFALPAIEPGRYEATVTSLDAEKLESAPSKVAQFRIVGAVLPPGATAASGHVRLPLDSRLQLLQAEGLELSYGGASAPFVPAPPSIALNHNRPVVLRLRDVATSREAQLRLEPLDVTPTITLGPARASWPGAPLALEVTFRHSDGRIAPVDDGITLDVTVNNRATKANVQRKDGKLVSKIERPRLAGPWVVRVFVRDAAGRELGHDFLEVAVNADPLDTREIAFSPLN